MSEEDGSEISQLVEEPKRAWHIAATVHCTLNSNHDCARNGQQSNHFTIGIEHAGFASQSSWSTSQIDASARLVCDITRDRRIPRDQIHIVAHGKLQPYNRTDPGPNWPWADYLRRIEQHCGSTLIIDSNNGANDPATGRAEISASWTESAATAGHYGTGYAFAATQAVSDPATFWFYLDAPRRARSTPGGLGDEPRAERAVSRVDVSGERWHGVRAQQERQCVEHLG